MADITLTHAQQAVDAALNKAKEMGVKMDIAVVDAGANLKAFARMDGAWLGSIDIAQKKARTARWFDMPTGDIGGLSQPGGPLFNIEHSNNGLITFPGGLPLKTAVERSSAQSECPAARLKTTTRLRRPEPPSFPNLGKTRNNGEVI